MSLADRLKAMLQRISGAAGPSAAADAVAAAEPPADRGLDPADLAVLAVLGRCTACRACDVAFGAYEQAARPVFRGPSELVMTYARSIDDHGAAKSYVESLKKGDVAELERICPVGIPFVALADLVERRAQALEPDEPSPDDSRPRHDPG